MIEISIDFYEVENTRREDISNSINGHRNAIAYFKAL